MPTTYTHDAFGKETYQKLPEEIKNMIRENKKLYLIGLHGPDILFYYKPYRKNEVSSLGYNMHEEKARIFFEETIKTCRETGSKPLMVYLIGFVCHYILDSCCHPFVYHYQEESGLSHAEIETELDRYFMERDGKNPFTYHPASSISPSKSVAETIHMAFPLFSEKTIHKTLEGMKFYCNLTVTRYEWKRSMFHKILKCVKADREMGGRIVEKERNAETIVSTEELKILYQNALEEVVPAIINLYHAIEGDEILSERFDRNYCN